MIEASAFVRLSIIVIGLLAYEKQTYLLILLGTAVFSML